MWDLDRVRALVDGHCEGWLFVAGCVANQGVVVLLSARVDVPSPASSTFPIRCPTSLRLGRQTW